MAKGQSEALAAAPGADSMRAIYGEMLRLRAAADRPGATPADVAALRKLFKAHPGLTGCVRALAKTTEATLMGKVVAQAGAREICMQELQGVRDRLGYQGAGEMERLLIAQICLAWLRLQWVECQAAEMSMGEGGPIQVVMFWEKRLAIAQKRFTRAVESLAKVRKLAERKPDIKVGAWVSTG